MEIETGTRTFATECRNYPAAWVIAPRSYLVDRIVPELAWIHRPEFTRPGGTFTFEFHGTARMRPTGRIGIKSRWKSLLETAIDIRHDLLVDLRVGAPQNWALFHMLHLSILCKAAAEYGFDIDDVGLLLPANTPGYIRRSAAMFGLNIYCTDSAVSVPTISFEMKDAYLATDNSVDWIRPFLSRLNDRRRVGISPSDPKRYFLSRRGTRNLENEDEVQAFLLVNGFETIYPEDLNVEEQFAVFDRAEIVVAIHGAGMAPLVYRAADSNLKLVVEICPVGHMVKAFRMRAADTNVSWIGVQGRLKKEYFPDLYNPETDFRKYSLDSFEVDVEALRAALEKHNIPTKG